MSGAEQALATLRDYVERSTHWREGGADRHAAKQALTVLDAWMQADDDGRCPTCGEDGGTSCGVPNCGLLLGSPDSQGTEIVASRVTKGLADAIPNGPHLNPHAEWILVRLDFVQDAIALLSEAAD